jgi:Tfp pilus assembly protein PilF
MQLKNTRQWSNPRTRAGFIALAFTLALLAGCASGQKVKPEPLDQALPVAEGPTVTRLEDGREGFVIKETPTMDAASRGDFERAVAMMNDGDFAQATPLLERVIGKAPEVTAPYIDLALAYEHIGKTEKAEEYLQLALRLFPDHPAASNEYGLLLRKSGRFAEARQIYEKALAAFPEYLPARRNLGILCDLYLSDPACALEQYEIFSEALPGDEQVKVWIADLQLRAGGN